MLQGMIAMSNLAWDCLYLYFTQVESIYAKMIALQTEPSPSILLSSEDDPEQMAVNFLTLHDELLANIALCEKSMQQHITEDEWQHILSPLVFHSDEIVLTGVLEPLKPHPQDCPDTCIVSLQTKTQWPKLQKELLKCRNGGERFFTDLEQLLSQPSASAMAIQVYYFCLKQGFKGRYLNQPEALQVYLQRCTKAIKQNLTNPKQGSGSGTKQRQKSEPQIGGSV
jgi:hypothetical protein